MALVEVLLLGNEGGKPGRGDSRRGDVRAEAGLAGTVSNLELTSVVILSCMLSNA